ncbi:hypothetical protein LTR78_003838 [Recurvomyces mirabilis]|uniref:Uncharacterized protein n=1 Tax=Recurvomyces mirabilis TaxID=574656 RepID=A0AAE0WQF1_9PEZI|nr:hypothetical protein LTR78_003838 [Recurvomyces mirabilis]KAK5154023.1 hypothetical protein LTS14_007243 [Recurvomyces mirabilis]
MTQISPLLAVPPEIRELIYRIILHPDASRHYHDDEYTSYDYTPALVLFRINKQIYHESRKIFRDLNTFIRIETPWPEAQQHVAAEGHVPMIACGTRAARFAGYSMRVRIDAPEVPMEIGDEQMFLVLLNDLTSFAKMWYYSNLSHPGLNPQLRLTLDLHDPFTPDYEEKRMLKGLQRKLILPFGQVRDLRDIIVTGDPKPFPSIEAEMREEQARPQLSPEHCLREGTRLKQLGNDELKKGNYQEALRIYNEAWLAIHVVIAGHKRHIHADRYFSRELREEPYIGKNGQTERLILRVQLVANTCQVFLKLHDYAECVFWGKRTINMLREAVGADVRQDISPEDEVIRGFPAADQMGKIYYRTAIALKELDNSDEARRLLRVAIHRHAWTTLEKERHLNGDGGLPHTYDTAPAENKGIPVLIFDASGPGGRLPVVELDALASFGKYHELCTFMLSGMNTPEMERRYTIVPSKLLNFVEMDGKMVQFVFKDSKMSLEGLMVEKGRAWDWLAVGGI